MILNIMNFHYYLLTILHDSLCLSLQVPLVPPKVPPPTSSSTKKPLLPQVQALPPPPPNEG